MKRTRFGMIGAALACSTVVLPVSVTATPAEAAAPHCQHGSGYGVVVDAEPLVAGRTKIGTIELCRDSNYQYWAFVLFTKPATVSQWGQAALVRYDQVAYESEYDCDSRGGNARVKPGQTRCWTPKVNGRAGRWNFAAVGFLKSSHTGEVIAAEDTVIQR